MIDKARVAAWLQRRFLLRLHMTFILGGTFLAGLSTTHALLVLDLVPNLALRYGVAVCAAYLAFLVLIRLWLQYVGVHEDNGAVDFAGDAADVVTELEWDVDVPRGGGGSFGGGGASGSWQTASTPQPMTVMPQAPRASSPSSSSSSWKLPSFSFDMDEWLVVVLFLALVTSLLFAGIYIIYTAPMILTEAAFEALLAGALVRRARKIDRPGWVGAVTRATAWPFIAILVLSIGLGWAVQKSCPEATRMRDAFHCAKR